MLKRQEALAVAQYLAGRPWPEVERLALRRMQTWHEDFFAADYNDVMEVLE